MRTCILRLTLGLVCALLSIGTVSAQVAHGTVREGETVKSKILDERIEYSVYLPYDYDTSNRRYPVVYLLHGYGDDDAGWVQFGEVALIADEAIAAREITPMIIVMPDAKVTFYINSYDGSVRYEDFFVEEFMPQIEQEYRVRSERRYRGVAGLSMGGHGALVFGLRYPGLFGGLAAFSAALLPEERTEAASDEGWIRTLAELYGLGGPEDRRTAEHYLSHSPLHLARSVSPAALRGLRIYLDCGDDDELSVENAKLHVALKRNGIAHEYRVRDGAHTWGYWRSGLVEGLKFLTVGFHQP